MPKGDRFKLKADPEDGTTPVANLLLEAVAMAKISGLQKGAILYLWRATYGWKDGEGKRKKEAKITLGDWVVALDRDKSRIAKALGELCDMNIMLRRVADVWGGYYYSLNTNIASWNSSSINLSKLSDKVGVAHLPTVDENTTVGGNDNSGQKQQQLVKTPTVGSNDDATVGENATPQWAKTPPPTLYKENIKKLRKKEGSNKNLSPERGQQVAEVFKRLDKLRGYRVEPKRKAEAVSIIRMLKTYTPDQIIQAWEQMKQDNFWQGKELTMMSVESQIGAVLKDGTHRQSPGRVRTSPDDYTDPDELRA